MHPWMHPLIVTLLLVPSTLGSEIWTGYVEIGIDIVRYRTIIEKHKGDIEEKMTTPR